MVNDGIWFPLVELAQGAVKGFDENKAGPAAASAVFINAILCAERPILSNKNNTEDPDENADTARLARIRLAAPGRRFRCCFSPDSSSETII